MKDLFGIPARTGQVVRKGVDVPSAGLLALTSDEQYFHVTGTTTITAIAARPPGWLICLEFDGILTLTHNATSLILPNAGANITTEAGDVATFISEGAGNWRCLFYTSINAAPGAPPRPGGRLTLATATPVLVTTFTAATTVYYTPFFTDVIPIYDGTKWVVYEPGELSIALDSNAAHTGYHQSGKNFDLFAVNDAGTRRLGTGPAWSTDTARGTGAGTTELSRVNGLWTNANSLTLRWGSAAGNTITVPVNQGTYLGTLRASADGQTQMKFSSPAALFLFDATNPVSLPLVVLNTTSHAYPTAAWRAWNNDAANSQVQIVVGLPTWVAAVYRANITVVAGGGVSIGVDSTSTPGMPKAEQFNNVADVASSDATPLAVGYHFLVFIEFGSLTAERVSLTALAAM